MPRCLAASTQLAFSSQHTPLNDKTNSNSEAQVIGTYVNFLGFRTSHEPDCNENRVAQGTVIRRTSSSSAIEVTAPLLRHSIIPFASKHETR